MKRYATFLGILSMQAMYSQGAWDAALAPQLQVEFTDDATFKVLLHSQVWFESGPLRFYSNGLWHQTGKEFGQQATLVKTGVKHSRGTDIIGSYSSINVSWSASGPSNTALHTTLKAYNDGVTAIFQQEIPAGAMDTNASNPILPGGTVVEGGAYPPVLSFPSFAASAGKLPNLGYVTWQGCMVNIDFGVNASAHLQGLSSNGPVAVFDSDLDTTTVVISPMDNFKNAVHSYSTDTGAWETGVSSEVVSIPTGFVHRTLLVVGSGVTSTMAAWGDTLRKVYHTDRIVNKDLVTNYLSYWTDNGAYYYGDQWGEAGGGGETCNEDAMLDVASGLEQQNLLDAVKIWQLDDWWYPGPQKVWVHCVHNWTLAPPAFNHNLSWLSEKVKTPWLLYVPFFCPDSVYADKFQFVTSAPGEHAGNLVFAEPHPDHAVDFYRMLFDYGIHNGMKAYENDFLNFNFLSVPMFRKNLGASRKWLQGIDTAAMEHNVPVQMCMALPSDLMQSVELNSVTNYRASGDYAGGSNYNIGGSALLALALDLRPSKDNFWTHRPESAIETGKPWGPSSNPGSNCELNTIIATFSTGPVGIADKAGDTNKTLVLRSVRPDGLILQPDRPATCVDAMFLQKLVPKSRPLHGAVWSSYAAIHSSSGEASSWYYALSIDVTTKWQLAHVDFYPKMQASAGWVARRWHDGHMPRDCTPGTPAVASGCLIKGAIFSDGDMPYILNDRPIMVENDTHVFDLIQLSPIGTNGWVLLGETSKYVSVSSKRFQEVHYAAAGIDMMVAGSAGEKVAITALCPSTQGAGQEWIVMQQSLAFQDAGVKTVSFSNSRESSPLWV